MTEHHETWTGAITKTAAWILAWYGSVKLADIQILISIISSCLVGCLAAVNMYIVWRDKIRGKK